MRSEWKEVVLADICSYRQERVDVETLTESSYVSTANMVPNRGGIEVADKLPNTTTTSRFIFGDVLISNIRPYFKKSWLASKDGGCSNDVLVMQAKEGIDTTYLYYLLSSDDFFAYMTATSKGTKMPRGDKDAIMKHEVKIPPLATQKVIAETLSCLDAKIELNNKINENLEAQAQAMFKSWFVDFEPFQDGEFVESELGLIPEGWRVGLLGEFIELSSGKRPEKKAEIASFETPIPILGASKIMGYTDSVLFDEPILVTGRVGTHGVIQRHDSKCWPSDNTLVMRASHYEFVYQCLKRIDFASLNRGSTQPLITQTDLNNQAIAAPTACILRQFEHLASELMALINLNHQESAMLASLRDTLLPKLMSGEIEVPID